MTVGDYLHSLNPFATQPRSTCSPPGEDCIEPESEDSSQSQSTSLSSSAIPPAPSPASQSYASPSAPPLPLVLPPMQQPWFPWWNPQYASQSFMPPTPSVSSSESAQQSYFAQQPPPTSQRSRSVPSHHRSRSLSPPRSASMPANERRRDRERSRDREVPSSYAVGSKKGKTRTFVTPEELKKKNPAPKSEINYVSLVQPKTTEEQIKEREDEYQMPLDKAECTDKLAKYAHLKQVTLPRMRTELPLNEAKLLEWKSKKAHWRWAMDLHRMAEAAGQVDVSLRRAKKPKAKSAISPKMAKKAKEFVAGKKAQPILESDSEDFVASEDEQE